MEQKIVETPLLPLFPHLHSELALSELCVV